MEPSNEPSNDRGRRATPSPAWLVRVVLLLAAGAAVVAGFGLARPRQAAPFACPMHAEIRAAQPGTCPVCGMALERGAARAGAEAAAPPLAATAVDLITVRSRVFSREVRGPARVDAPDGRPEVVALLHADDLDPARTEEDGVFTPADGTSSVPIEAVDAVPIVADDATSWVRFRPRLPLPVNATGWVSWPARPRATLVVPDTAVVRDADGPYVLVAAEGAPLGLEKRSIKIGKAFQSLGVVVSGLAPGERVLADGAFSWDAERRLRAAGPTAHAP